jgi:two-component system, OmpR family, KDP operon response regulator KdpE
MKGRRSSPKNKTKSSIGFIAEAPARMLRGRDWGSMLPEKLFWRTEDRWSWIQNTAMGERLSAYGCRFQEMGRLMNSKPVKVLVVDNDASMRRTLRTSLAAQGYSVTEARSGEEAVHEMEQKPADLVLLDVEMPGMGGLEACRRIRAFAPQTGVVMVTVCDGEEDKIGALESGADDYVTKPFSIRELLARLRALSRRLGMNYSVGASVLKMGDLELDLERRILRRAGTEIHLSPTEFSLLSYLMQHANTAIEHGKLLRAIWGPEYGSELEYLRTYIKRLRRKIENDAINPEYLLTVPWLGYRFRDPSVTVPEASEELSTASAE